MITLRLPWPPSVNHYWRYGNGHFYISTEGRRYKLAVCGIIATANVRPLEGNVKITIDAFPPDRRRRDIDNLEKALMDACIKRDGFATGLFLDDSQVKRKISTMWDYHPDYAGQVMLSIEPWDGGAEAPVFASTRPPAKRAPTAAAPPPKGDTPWPPVPPKSLSDSGIPTFPITANPLLRLFGVLPSY